MGKMARKVELGQRVRVKVWREPANHWDWGSEEIVTGIVVNMPVGTYQNNWNFNAKEFDIRTDDGNTIHVKNPSFVEVIHT